MKKTTTIVMVFSMLFIFFSSMAQPRVVSVPATTDFSDPSDLFPVIMGDTLEDGSRTDVNTVYKLENGGFYITSGTLRNKHDWPLQIEAEDLTDTNNKPVISRIPNASGSYPNIMYPEGDFTLKNLWIISGEKGPLEDHDWGKIRVSGENSRVILENCLIEKDRGGFLQIRANGTKIYIDNSTFRNAGNRRKVQGNGRIVDAREFMIDSLVVTNSIMYNIHDRIFRSQGGTAPHNYIEFDHNTIFNHFGRHGCFQFGQAGKVVVTNNLISNPIMQGTTPVYTDEQTQVDTGAHKVFTIDGEDVATDFTFANNNIFWTQDVLDYYASNDTVSKVEVYSQEILAKLGGEQAAAATYFSEPLELNSVPQSILQLVVDTYADPASTEMFDIIVEDITRAGTAYDSGNLFDFTTFDAGYDPASLSARGATDGTYVGAVFVKPVFTSEARIVKIPATTDFADPSDIFPVIMGDTVEGGARVDANTIYQLENGGFYITSGTLRNKPNWPLQIETEDLTDTGNKAVISRIPNASGSYPNIMYPEGDFTLKNLWIISGEKGPLEDHDWGKIRVSGENSRVILENCLIEKDRGGFLQIRANGAKIYIDNSTFRNAGNRRKVQGNGRIVDAREFMIDSLVVTNSIMYNIHDRIFRSQGGTAPHNYIEFDHNTIFNHFGRHGCFQFGQANKVVVTNNFISNPIMQGTTPVYTDEQTQVDTGAHKVFTIDGEDVATDFTFANNNIFWTQDVLDYYAGNDTVSKVEVYSQEILAKLGGEQAAAATYFSEPLELNSVPQSILQLVIDTYADPASTEMFDIIVEDITRAETAYDSGNLFDFTTFDAAYVPTAQSATGDTEGSFVGAVEPAFPVNVLQKREYLNTMEVYPNPSFGPTSLAWSQQKAGQVRISVLDFSGKLQLVLLNEFRQTGENEISFDLSEKLNAGLYLIQMQTTHGISAKKLIVK